MRSFTRLSTFLFVQSVLSLTFKSEEIDANFDDRNFLPASSPAAIESNAVGLYGSLYWPGFSIDQPMEPKDDEEFEGVELKSEPHYAAGRVDFFGGLPQITSIYFGTNVGFFDMQGFWWGCSTTVDSGAQVPGWCELQVNGYAHDSKEPIAQALTFFFPKEDTISMAMVEAHLPSTFNGINRVEFKLVGTNAVFFVDDVRYKVYNVTDMGKGLGEVIHSSETSQSEFVMQVRGRGQDVRN